MCCCQLKSTASNLCYNLCVLDMKVLLHWPQVLWSPWAYPENITFHSGFIGIKVEVRVEWMEKRVRETGRTVAIKWKRMDSSSLMVWKWWQQKTVDWAGGDEDLPLEWPGWTGVERSSSAAQIRWSRWRWQRQSCQARREEHRKEDQWM